MPRFWRSCDIGEMGSFLLRGRSSMGGPDFEQVVRTAASSKRDRDREQELTGSIQSLSSVKSSSFNPNKEPRTLNSAYRYYLLKLSYSSVIIRLRPALPSRTSVYPNSPGVYPISSPLVNILPSTSGNVIVGSRTISGGVFVK